MPGIMSENKKSNLNPLASSFIPNKNNENSYLKEMAEKYIKDLLEKKGAKGEKSLTKLEMANLVGQLISLRFKVQNPSDFLKINRYLSDKILQTDDTTLKLQAKSAEMKPVLKSKFETFDLHKFQLPKISYLLVSFWGLYRHEQAQRPVLSLTSRPEIVKDKIWSLDSSDMKLWNPSSVENCCACPPMFGYTIPSVFFGKLSHLSSTCPVQDVHLNHYNNTDEGNEFILTSSRNCNALDEQPFEDFEILEKKIDMNLLKEQFKAVVAGLCEVLLKYEKTSEEINQDCEEIEKDVYQEYGTFWDDDCDSENSRNPSIQSSDELADDNNHPLLEVELFEDDDEGVSLEIAEMIRRSLSPKKDCCAEITDIAFEQADEHADIDEKGVICDPPCSIWCSANGKENATVLSVDVESNMDTKTKLEAPVINLLSAEQLKSQQNDSTADVVDLKPSLCESKGPKPNFRRSFSVNDCDPFYFDTKLNLNGAKKVFNTLSSKDVLTYLRKDPVNFFKSFDRSNSWKDNDSGIVTHWSSQDDIFERDQDDRESMWTLFSGEDSLWKPLPECAAEVENEEKPLAHKRVRDLRRQRSLN